MTQAVRLDRYRQVAPQLHESLRERILSLGPRAKADMAAFSRADQSFHHEIYAACGQENLYALVQSLSGHIAFFRD